MRVCGAVQTGGTSLIFVCANGHAALVPLLLAAGADAHAADQARYYSVHGCRISQHRRADRCTLTRHAAALVFVLAQLAQNGMTPFAAAAYTPSVGAVRAALGVTA
jgi:ankyrin repeat protein